MPVTFQNKLIEFRGERQFLDGLLFAHTLWYLNHVRVAEYVAAHATRKMPRAFIITLYKLRMVENYAMIYTPTKIPSFTLHLFDGWWFMSETVMFYVISSLSLRPVLSWLVNRLLKSTPLSFRHPPPQIFTKVPLQTQSHSDNIIRFQLVALSERSTQFRD